jgi:hypothetical protein
MQYFYLRISQITGGVRAQTGGIYRDDVLFSLLPEGDISLALVNPTPGIKNLLKSKAAGQKVRENFYTVTSRKKVTEFIRHLGPGKALSHEDAYVFIYAGRLPQELDPKDLQGAYAAATFKKRGSIIEVPEVTRLEPLVGRALVKLLGPHLKKPHRAKLREEAHEILKPAEEGVVATAARTGITVNNFPGPGPGLCTLWFVTGEELTLARRTALTQDPPASMDIGEITLTPEWSALLGLIPALIYKGNWWLLPGACAAAALALGLGSRFLLHLKRRALNKLRAEMLG